MKKIYTICFILLFVLFNIHIAFAQMQRKRATVTQVVDDTFWSPTLVTQATTHQLGGGVLNVTILHSFGIATDEPIKNFFGLDQVQNVRLGLDFGITDWWSAGIGRSSLANVIDIRTKVVLVKQSMNGKMPLSISLKGDLAVITQENLRPFIDDISTLVSAILSRKFNKTISFQVIPMFAHFNNFILSDDNNYFAVGLGTAIHLNKRFALMAEYYPVIGNRPSGTTNSFSLGLNIKTGGHVFQLFFASTRWHIPQFIISRNDNNFWAGDFRFGFNINRVFGL